MKSNVKRNTLPTLLSAIALAGVMAASAHAQMLGGLSVSPPAAKVGEPVTVTASIDVVSANYCGFIVFFGDGTSAESVIDVNKPSPFVVSHTYAKAGQFTLSLGGRSVQSHPNCGGADKMATVTITEAAKPAAAPVAEPAKPAREMEAGVQVIQYQNRRVLLLRQAGHRIAQRQNGLRRRPDLFRER